MKFQLNREFFPWYGELETKQKIFVWLSYILVVLIFINFFYEMFNSFSYSGDLIDLVFNFVFAFIASLIASSIMLFIIFTFVGLPIAILLGLSIGILKQLAEYYKALGEELRSNE